MPHEGLSGSDGRRSRDLTIFSCLGSLTECSLALNTRVIPRFECPLALVGRRWFSRGPRHVPGTVAGAVAAGLKRTKWSANQKSRTDRLPVRTSDAQLCVHGSVKRSLNRRVQRGAACGAHHQAALRADSGGHSSSVSRALLPETTTCRIRRTNPSHS